MKSIIFRVVLLIVVLFQSYGVYAKAKHPLDPLSRQEIKEALSILSQEGLVNDKSRYEQITLQEPPKSFVKAFAPEDLIPRSAFVVIKNKAKVFEAVVNLTERTVESFTRIPGAQTAFLDSDYEILETLTAEDETFMAELAKLGVTDIDTVVCDTNSVGYFGFPDQAGKRLARAICYVNDPDSTNFYARPIESVSVLVDLNARKVVDVSVLDPVPISPKNRNLDPASIGDLRVRLKPVVIDQPKGVNFTLDGNMVHWQNWSFHVRFDKRVGLIISDVKYKDKDEFRSIMYQSFISEVVVPYMDPTQEWFFKSFYDVGEFQIGYLTYPLEIGTDVPDNAVVFNPLVPDDRGRVYRYDNAYAIFERNLGNPMWRHFDENVEELQSRPSVELVVRFITTIGNYDYLLDWVFTQDGRMRMAVGATGILAPKGVTSRSLFDGSIQEDRAYGELVDELIAAPNHDHYFLYRLDMDIDGEENSFSKDNMRRRQEEDYPFRSYWVLERFLAQREADAQLKIRLDKPALWRIFNPNATRRLGHHPGYILRPTGSAAYSLLAEDDFVQRRAGFTDYNLWVTPYQPNELYAAGNYPNQSQPGEGLPKWTAANRSIVNRDLVLWYSIGMHHAPSVEEWPVMPVVWHSFELKPYNFFDENPALGLRKRFKK